MYYYILYIIYIIIYYCVYIYVVITVHNIILFVSLKGFVASNKASIVLSRTISNLQLTQANDNQKARLFKNYSSVRIFNPLFLG